MNEIHNVSLDAISKGRGLGSVLVSYMQFFDNAKLVSIQLGRSEDEAVSDAMMGAAYRLYLLGVEDGMGEDHERIN